MDVYLASPRSQLQADKVKGMPVLMSYGCYSNWMDRYVPSYGKLLIDSGAYSVLNSGTKIDLGEFREWSERFMPIAEAVAGLDDISGDWKQGLKNYEAVPWSFPTWHDTDPIELIPDLVALARERKTWIAIGLDPPRYGKERIVRDFLEQIPDDLHVHGWALRAYTHLPGIDSVDSTNWFRDSIGLAKEFPWLTPAECLEIVVKRYKRQPTIEAIQPKREGDFWG
jgi:hypothetical protein|tara:strand:+ start:299 stop:973 length:675 start_codon:yes stop_codon:yes gene_type:complete